MSNMSYCRFENTDKDLADCQDALEGILHGSAEDQLGRRELDAMKSLVNRCFNITQLLAEAVGFELETLDANSTRDAVDAYLVERNTDLSNEDEESAA